MENTINATEVQGTDVETEKKVHDLRKDADFWQNEIDYFNNAIDGLKMAYALINDLKNHATISLENLKKNEE